VSTQRGGSRPGRRERAGGVTAAVASGYALRITDYESRIPHLIRVHLCSSVVPSSSRRARRLCGEGTLRAGLHSCAFGGCSSVLALLLCVRSSSRGRERGRGGKTLRATSRERRTPATEPRTPNPAHRSPATEHRPPRPWRAASIRHRAWLWSDGSDGSEWSDGSAVPRARAGSSGGCGRRK
jgi:hypothetical protein